MPVRAKPNQGRNKAFLRATLLPRPGPNPAPETFKGFRDVSHPEPAQREGNEPLKARPHRAQESRLQIVKCFRRNLARRSEVVLEKIKALNNGPARPIIPRLSKPPLQQESDP